MESQSSVWVLSNLWKKGSLFYSKLKILDTILASQDSLCPFLWLYTDSKGYIRKKPNKICSSEAVVQSFINENEIRKEDVFGHYIYGNEYFPLSKKQLTNKIFGQGLSEAEAIQAFPKTPGNTKTRYIAQFSNKIMKFYIQHTILSKTENVKLNSSKHSLYMAESLKSLIKTLEKNAVDSGKLGPKQKIIIEDITLLFVEDVYRELWFIGIEDCKVSFAYEKSSYFNSNSSKALTPSSFSKSLLGKKNFSHTHCKGDFCNIVIKSNDLRNKTEIDYDNLVIHKQLQKVSVAYREKQDKALEKIKLSLRADHLLTQRLKTVKTQVFDEVAYKNILLGRRVLVFNSLNFNPNDLIEIYYDNVKVCKRCYQIYSLFSLPLHPKIEEKKETKVMNFDNLDDLLEDIRNLKFDLKHGENKAHQLPQFSLSQKSIYRENFSHSNNSYQRRVTVRRIEGINDEKLTEELFPDAKFLYRNKKTDREYYKNYLSKLKLGSL